MEGYRHIPVWGSQRVQRTNVRGRHSDCAVFKAWVITRNDVRCGEKVAFEDRYLQPQGAPSCASTSAPPPSTPAAAPSGVGFALLRHVLDV
jgi:hypothetical protein